MAEPSSQECYVALELSRAKWLVGALLPGRSKVTTTVVPGGDTAALLDALGRFAARAGRETGQAVAAVRVCFEAGYDGFWLARFLFARGIETHVLDPASFLVSRRGRRAKTDRIDVEAMAFTLRAFLLGDRSVCREVVIPSPEQEDAKRLSRERTQLAAEKTRHTNRIRGLLALHGIREVSGLWGGEWAEALGGLRTGDGRELGGYLRAEIAREFERLHLVLRHMRALDADRQAALTQEASAFPHRHKAGVLIKLAGVGPITATALVAEVFHRRFQSRRHLASYLGLAPTPFASGGRRSTRAGRADATRASARRATSRRAACWSSSPGAGCATSPAAVSRPGTGGPSPNGGSGGARSGSWPWPANWRSPCGALLKPGSCPKER
jgi:transposase